MASYRAYKLDKQDQPHGAPCIVEAQTDEDAIAQAKQLLNGQPIQLWRADRIIATLPPRFFGNPSADKLV